jgi:class 3 adenylate cyclase
VLDHFVNLLDFSRNDLFRCANETDNQLIPRLRSINQSVAIFIDSVDEYFEKHIRTDPGRGADAGEVSPSIWYFSQMALVEVAYELRRVSHQLKVFAAVRKEAFARFAGITPMVQQYRGTAVDIEYSASSLREIFVNNVQRERQKNLVLRKSLQQDPIEAFLGRTEVLDSFTGESEEAFDYIRRHTLLRPRDFMTIGQKLSSLDPEERGEQDRFKAAVNAAALEIAQEYLNEIEPGLGELDVTRLFSLIPSNVLTRSELRALIRRYDGGAQPGVASAGALGGAPGERGIQTIFNAGLLGYVDTDAATGGRIQRFLSPGEVSLDQEGGLPASSHYLLRPILTGLVARLNPGFAKNIDRANIVAGGRPWKDPKKARGGYRVEDLFVLHADIKSFSRMMEDSQLDRGVREAFARAAQANTAQCMYLEIVNGDSLWIVHDDPNALLKVASRIKEDLFEAPGHPELRMAADFGPVQLKRDDRKRLSLAGGDAVLRVSRIEPRVRVSEIWVTGEFKRELDKRPTLYGAFDLQPDEEPGSSAGSVNVRKEASDQKDILVDLYRIGPKAG